jgi:hypothetical protein
MKIIIKNSDKDQMTQIKSIPVFNRTHSINPAHLLAVCEGEPPLKNQTVHNCFKTSKGL